MKFLSAFGKLFKLGARVGEAGPLLRVVASLTPTKADDKAVDSLLALRGVVQTVEAIGYQAGLTGPQKLAAAAPLVADLLLQSPAFHGFKVARSAEFEAAVLKITSGVVDALNCLEVPAELRALGAGESVG